ncbi:MAG TPA: tripeptide aminopeptidase PepT, partial [Thermoanaerobaculia bacterium]|nr:tripeptide aminopeptidase PepT [Thermoanaerobaculia bacterium]
MKIDTQSTETSDTYPSTAKQLDLLRLLVDELKEIGLADATIDEHGYVMATIPATTKKTQVPVIGFIAHVDTSPEMSGAGVKPIIHKNYQGQDLVLPDDPTAVLRPADNPYLGERIGDDIITASGTTLLGADNKSGVAEIVAAAEYLLAHPEIPHGPIRIGFTPDEEVGTGTKYFDVARFGAKYAYTMDGGPRGEIEYESFSADAMTITFQGRNTHPGYAKGVMV